MGHLLALHHKESLNLALPTDPPSQPSQVANHFLPLLYFPPLIPTIFVTDTFPFADLIFANPLLPVETATVEVACTDHGALDRRLTC